ncbi:hypothetical protein RUM43_005183 [Polyplax serrata]|uniref:DUF4770 domain-containing protein n=1 Tax=Polyplax serrata TaxID=468196 RepID=A0AAN8XMB9_POLSC
MQGRQNAANSERKGPHKSMHCKFCKPPGVVTPEKPTRPQLETKTKIHLTHEAADLRLCDTYDEPGVPVVDEEACLCVLEGENPCPKCVPDKKRGPVKKKTCRCPKGAKPNPNLNDGATPKKKKPKDLDDEFWWEKYSREHDAIAQETWAAYMAQRRKNKKLVKCQKREQEKLIIKNSKYNPVWYQKLSCQQMIYVEFLSTAIRLDSDENITDRTFFVLGGIGLYPRPTRKVLKKCLRYCQYNAINFLNQLHLMTKNEDVFNEKDPSSILPGDNSTWNERLIMNAICHLEFPRLLRELMDRLPPLPRDKILPQIPYPVYPKLPKKKYLNPYEEPIWQEKINWVEKQKIDRINRCRNLMDNKRIKIPPLALVRRPSLIDARPSFLAQIEANEKASRRIQTQEDKKSLRKHPVSTFNSDIDVTAIAGITASEISSTDKADTDEICVFLREPNKGADYLEEEEMSPEKEVKFAQEEPEVVSTEIDKFKPFSDLDEISEPGEIPFKTPPKTESGTTMEPCPPPETSPGPPALHYDVGKRELDIINEELCRFYPFVTSSNQGGNHSLATNDDEVTQQLLSAAEKLKQYANDEPETTEEPNVKKKPRKLKKKSKGKCTKKKNAVINRTGKKKELGANCGTGTKESEIAEKVELPESDGNGEASENLSEEMTEEDMLLMDFRGPMKKEKKKQNRSESIISDPDPSYDERYESLPCLRDTQRAPQQKRKRSKSKRKKGRKTKTAKKKKEKDLGESKTDNANLTKMASERDMVKENRGTMTECYPGEYDNLYEEKGEIKKAKKPQDQGAVFEGNIEPLLMTIIKDLEDEGFVSASYQGIVRHPDIEQLIKYLKGEIVTKKIRNDLHVITKAKWAKLNERVKYQIPDLGISSSRLKDATWRDKGWIFRRAKAKKDEFYFKIGISRNEFSCELYKTLFQSYFGTGRFLKIYYAYMLPKYEEAILKGVA